MILKKPAFGIFILLVGFSGIAHAESSPAEIQAAMKACSKPFDAKNPQPPQASDGEALQECLKSKGIILPDAPSAPPKDPNFAEHEKMQACLESSGVAPPTFPKDGSFPKIDKAYEAAIKKCEAQLKH